jgi:hypothetical protein
VDNDRPRALCGKITGNKATQVLPPAMMAVLPLIEWSVILFSHVKCAHA